MMGVPLFVKMGRRKIEIAKINNERNKQVTFAKRKKGLMKKAEELGVLCDCDVAVIVFNSSGRCFSYLNKQDNSIVQRYMDHVNGRITLSRKFEEKLDHFLNSTGGEIVNTTSVPRHCQYIRPVNYQQYEQPTEPYQNAEYNPHFYDPQNYVPGLDENQYWDYNTMNVQNPMGNNYQNYHHDDCYQNGRNHY